jgi:plastocyanin
MRRVLLVLLAGALAFVLSCGNDNAPTQPAMTTATPAAGRTATPTPPAPAATPTPSTGAGATVSVGPSGSMSFVDSQSRNSTTTIRAGERVTWNFEGFHSVTSGNCCNPDGNFDSGTMSSGSFSHTFPAAGSFPYFCTVHGSLMTGMVVVNP